MIFKHQLPRIAASCLLRSRIKKNVTLTAIIALSLLIEPYETNDQTASPSCPLHGQADYADTGEACSELYLSAANQQNESTNWLSLETSRDEQVEDLEHWRWKYVDEQTPEFSLRINEQSIETRVANLIYTQNTARFVNVDMHTFNSGDAELDRRREQLAAGSRVDDQLCGKHLEQMIALMGEMATLLEQKRLNRNQTRSLRLHERHIRLARILDSFGRYEAGALTGRAHFLGSYTQCVGSHMILEESGRKVAARYCMARYSLDSHLDVKLRERQRLSRESATAFNVAVCIPETCHTKSFGRNKHLLEAIASSQFELPDSIYSKARALELESVSCLVDSESELAKIPFSGRLLLGLLFAWLCVVVYASLAGEASNEHHLRPLLRALSLRESWSDFTDTSARAPPNSRVQLDVLNPIKVLGSMFVIFGHSIICHVAMSTDALRTFNRVELDWYLHLNMGGTVVVDTFYVITGILLGFFAMNRFGEAGARGLAPREFAKLSLQLAGSRYLRLIPLYFLVFWFKKSIFPSLGSGPLWDAGYNSQTMVGACRHESWLSPLTFMAAYKPLSQQCLPQAWSVASDLFFSAAFAPIIVLMASKPLAASLLAILISVSSNAAMLSGIKGLAGGLVSDFRELRFHSFAVMFNDHSYLYTAPHFRAFSVLIGVLAGFVLHHYNQRRKLSHWPNWFKGVATNLAVAVAALILLAPPLVPILKPNLLKLYPIHHALFEYSMTTGRMIWALSNAIILLRVTTDLKDNAWMRCCSSGFWRLMVRLSYPMLLVHIDVLYFNTNSQLELGVYSLHKLFTLFGATYFFTCLISVLLHVCFENPFDKLIKIYLNHKQAPTQQSKSELQQHFCSTNGIEQTNSNCTTKL